MKGRKGLLTVFGAFAAPVILAAIVYHMGWFNAGVTNKGEFMQNELTLSWLLPQNPADSEWIIFYPLPQNCEQQCDNVLYSLNQGYQALGKLQGKAHPVVTRANNASITPAQLKEKFGYINVIEQQPVHQSTLAQLSADYVYLVDPFGKVVLRYKATTDKQAMIMITKDWIADLKRLLKYSRTS
ncbi:MAG: hypothetical protein ACI9FJ_000543 [Alteromonadaceae bacterium]|jgi:hypothetical protein